MTYFQKDAANLVTAIRSDTHPSFSLSAPWLEVPANAVIDLGYTHDPITNTFSAPTEPSN